MTERNQSLDLLRGLAVLLMVAVHCSQVATSIVPDLRSLVMQYGELGVQLFFIVSGYTMMLTLGDKVDVAGAPSFYLRRVFRIFPGRSQIIQDNILASKAYRPKAIATVA